MEPTSAHAAMRATLALLLPLLCSSIEQAQQPGATVREYYIAAVEIGWDYEPHPTTEQRRRLSFRKICVQSVRTSKDIPQKYIKAIYREYTDSTYTVPKPRPAWTGIQGPVIVTQAGETVVVHFKNLASQPYSISPVGITYWKQSEGAGYDDSTAGQEKEDDAVSPGGYYEYVWDISPKDGPTTSDPDCLTYSYTSRVDTVRDLNSGLIGALLICKASAFTEDEERRYPAFVLFFAVFDETKSWYGEVGERVSREKFKRSNGKKEYHTINGFVNSTLPGLTMCQGRNPVFWHLIGMSTAPEIHSIQFQDHSLTILNHRKVTVEVTPMSFITAEMRPHTIGSFLISCKIHAHRHDGMNALFTVEKKCPEVVTPPAPNRRQVKHEEDYSDENFDDGDLFNVINVKPKNTQLQVRSLRGQESKTWVHYIAAEEVTWNYAPHLKPSDSYQYKKVVYVEYTDGSFTQRKDPESPLLGPILKGKVNDQFHITFKNLASRPFNIYPNGLTKIFPLQRSTNESDLHSMGVPPNKTFGYIWRLTTDDGPLEGDPTCLTQLYQSTVSPERDLASGLVGTLLICKYDAIDFRGRLLGPDKKFSLIFAIFDENRSWYFDENMRKSTQKSFNTTEPDFYNSNVIYSVNGIMFSRRQFVMCQTDVTFWHVASVGTQSDFLSVYFTGNMFQYQGLYQSVLTLFPMTAITLPMETELIGEWEISAFDSSLKNRGMSIHYTVRPCGNGDRDDDLSDYIDKIDFLPRGLRPENHTVLVRVCKKARAQNSTQSLNTTAQTEGTGPRCRLRKVNIASLKGGKAPSESEIPLDVLKELDRDGERAASENQTEHGERQRQRRQANRNETDEDISSEDLMDEEITMEIVGEVVENMTDIDAKAKAEESREMQSEKNDTVVELEESNEIILDREPLLSTKVSAAELQNSADMDKNLVPQNHIRIKPERLIHDLPDVEVNYTAANTTIDLSFEYDDYSYEVPGYYINVRSGGVRPRHYYIAAEEIIWNYGIRKPQQVFENGEIRRGIRKFLPDYKKVVFRAYKDKDFLLPEDRGELQEHLGIMGPVITTEINDLLTVTFKNSASRPFSFHLHGVYDRSQGASTAQTSSPSAPPGVPGEPVPPGEARTYNWRVTKKQGPTDSEFDCKTGAYYSTVDKEKDLHSGLIGPLVICKPGTLRPNENTQPGIQAFSLLFHTFDETKSWYLEENLKRHCAPPCQVNAEDPWYHTSNKFAAINGYVAETLPGLLLAQYQRVRWHLLNVGSDTEIHAVHFHGLPFTIHAKQEHRMGVYNLFPGVFGTVEMRPPTVGTWLVECTIGDYQLAGMRAKLLVYDPSTYYWEPALARLDQSGYINAWMGKNKQSWIQVDLQRPTLMHGVQTQGVRSRLREHYITYFTVSYSLDQETWTNYRGNETSNINIFHGNLDSSKVKENLFSPPFVARYIRIHPYRVVQRPALRLELLGCDLNSCSLPLGLQRKSIPDGSFSASSSHSSFLRTWKPSLARLHQEGGANAWRPMNNNPHEWLQVDLEKVRRITGVITQGARSLMTQMMVTEFSVTSSLDGHSWSSVLDERIFKGNDDPDEEAINVFEPPLFARYIRIHPRGWIKDIALRLEVLGCDTQQGV
uniref:F5/8 type C domain-containing protein n=1 Tax=Astatotilapia calliptera TaxID=8154 RepID=A0A3P8Q0C1_ASTCA